MTPAQILRETIKKDGKPERQLKQYEAMGFVYGTPVSKFLDIGLKKGGTAVDKFGVTFIYPEDAPGRMPHITAENKALKDITKWKETVHAPDIAGNCQTGWEESLAKGEEIRKEGKLVSVVMGTGIFEQLHFLMGFEDTLTNLYEHPREMHRLIDYILRYRMSYAKTVIDNLHPDLILSHDDWGAKDALFMKEDMWREFFKEPYRKFYGYIRSQGVIAAHHADSYCAPIVDDMAEIGIQIWQGVLPENNIPRLLAHLDGKLTLMGGVGASIDRADAAEEEIRRYMKEVLWADCPMGHFIPCITYGLPGTVYKQVDPIIDDEIDRYNRVLHAPNFRKEEHRRIKAEKTVVKKEISVAGESETGDTLTQLAAALKKGQKNRVLKLCNQAIEENIDRQTILQKGLVAGMVSLGNDFSANKVFVPEMLMAARCMTAATEILKPLLVKGESKSAGKVCMGTVKGDMHDIGKNLVKIMMEGSGLTVIDLGTDVSAETFVDTAIKENCDIICCSALLTTTMDEMKKVVALAKEKGIRDKIKIMIGGAPITQEYCDEIGADIYTADAAAAAKRAVNALANK